MNMGTTGAPVERARVRELERIAELGVMYPTARIVHAVDFDGAKLDVKPFTDTHKYAGVYRFCLFVDLCIREAFSKPDRPVVSVSGDGGFQMNIQELMTLQQDKIDIKIIIYNKNFLSIK